MNTQVMWSALESRLGRRAASQLGAVWPGPPAGPRGGIHTRSRGENRARLSCQSASLRPGSGFVRVRLLPHEPATWERRPVRHCLYCFLEEKPPAQDQGVGTELRVQRGLLQPRTKERGQKCGCREGSSSSGGGRGLWARVCTTSVPGEVGGWWASGRHPAGARLRAGGRCGESASHRGSWDHPGCWDLWPGTSGGDPEQCAAGPAATLGRYAGDTQEKEVNTQKHTSCFSPMR